LAHCWGLYLSSDIYGERKEHEAEQNGGEKLCSASSRERVEWRGQTGLKQGEELMGQTGENVVGRRQNAMQWTGLVVLTVAVAIAGYAQGSKTGVVRRLSDVRFPGDDEPKCLQFALENGDLNTGPSTAIMKATPGCVVAPHYHTAEEQLIIVRGGVATGMDGMSDTVLGPGGFAMMPSKRVHWFTCTGKEECLMFVTFDRAYDIVWVKQSK
jgi:quercetin dioxygenase-like cupin family protein